ncbi:MAG TPA: tyrosine-protein phosphatase [Parachlamydiaceae bacterium]|nr:tyrosine-protein phosphatase [Parachlamydiaceae bacterium]
MGPCTLCKNETPFCWLGKPIYSKLDKPTYAYECAHIKSNQNNIILKKYVISFLDEESSNQVCEKLVPFRFSDSDCHISDKLSTEKVIKDRYSNNFSMLDKPILKLDISSIPLETVNYSQHDYSVAAKNSISNRYEDAIPKNGLIYNPTQFEGKQLLPYYLNANKIELPNKEKSLTYIAAQAPKKNTFNEFWKAVVVGQSNIVTLALQNEDHEQKCDDYWSIAYWKEQHVFEIKDGDEIIGRLVKKGHDEEIGTISGILNQKKPKRSYLVDSASSSDDGHNIVKRTYEFTSTLTGEIQTITQFHYKGWPDRGAPDAKLFNRLLEILDETPTIGPLMVHCSAGIGRTGTLIAAHALRCQIKAQREKTENPAVDVIELIKQMRKQRARMVQSQAQLNAICLSVKDYMESLYG